MEGCEDVWFKRAIVELLAAKKKIPPLNIHHYVQPVYVDKRVDGSNQTMGTAVSIRRSGGEASLL